MTVSLRHSAIIASALLASGCATVTQGTHEGVRIESEPVGATALTDIPSSDPINSVTGYLGCEPTPCTISIPRKTSPKITISLDGYEPITFATSSAVATSATSVPAGALVAGLPPGSHVRAGDADFLKRIPVGGRVVMGALMTYGVGAIVDTSTGANLNLAPNPVTAFLSPKDTQAEETP